MIPLIPLVSFESAKEHMKLPDDNDAELKSKLLQASGIVLHHMKLSHIPDAWVFSDESPVPEVQPSGALAVPVWDTKDVGVIETFDSPGILIRVPSNVTTAVLFVVNELFEGRDPLPEAVINLLYGFRDPTFA